MRGPLRFMLGASPIARDPLYLRAGQMPSLDLRFFNRTIVDAISGNTPTFTRPSSTKLLWDSTQLQSYAADVPGFEPRNGGWEYVHEPAATNLYTNNRTFTVSSGHTLQTSGGQRLDGAGTLVKLVPNNGQDPSVSSNAGMLAGSTISLANATQYTQSIYAKAAEFNQVRLRSNASGQIYTFTLGSAPPAPTGSITASASELIGDGWYRLSWTFLSTSSAPGNRTDHWSIRAAVTGDGTSGFFVDLGQVELGSVATSPIVTAGSTVTRNADTMTISGLIANPTGVLYVEGSCAATGTQGLLSLNDNTANERLEVIGNGTDPVFNVVDDGASQASIDGGTIAAGVNFRLAASYGLNNFAVSVNGGTPVVDTSGTVPTFDRLFIGRNQAGNIASARLRRVLLFPGGPAQSRLQQLTA